MGLGNRKSFTKNVQALNKLPIKSPRDVLICSLSELKFSYTSYKTGSNIHKVANRPNPQEKSMDHFLPRLKHWRISYKKWTDNFWFRKLKASCWKLLLLLLKQHWENNKFWTSIKMCSDNKTIYSSSWIKHVFITQFELSWPKNGLYLLQFTLEHSYDRMFDWNICQRLPSYTSALKEPKRLFFEVTFHLKLLKIIFTFLTQFLSTYTRAIKIHDLTKIKILY